MNVFETNDYELLYMIHQKDESSLQILFQKYQPLILGMIKNFFIGSIVALHMDELKQEAQYCLYQAIYAYREDKGAMFSTFLRHLLSSHFQNYYRKFQSEKGKLTHRMLSLDRVVCDNGGSLMDILMNNKSEYEGVTYLKTSSLDQILAHHLQHLTLLEQQVCKLRMAGYRYEEIANYLQMDRKRVDYILTKIRKCRSSIDYELSLW